MSDKNMYESISEERKELQKNGKLPKWYTSAGYQMLKAKYLDDGETAFDRYKSVADTAAKHTNDPKYWSEKFFQVMWNGWLSPATPVLTNMGKPHKGMPVSCSGMYVGDSVYDFYESQKEAAVLSKNGFGTAGYLGDIRPRGSKFAANGSASGVMPVLKDFIQVSRDISQGANRRGAWASYYPIDGKDFYEVADYLFNYPDDNNIGWVLTQEWYDAIREGDQEAIKRWQRINKIRSTIGKGYMLKHWTANERRPQMYKDHGLEIKTSQLCVTGDQMVVSDRGMKTAYELYQEGGELTLFDNNTPVKSSPMKKIESDADVFKITLKNGITHTVTGYHKVKTDRGMVAASELTDSDKVFFQTNEGVFGKNHLPDEAFLLGLYQADGTQHKDTVFIDIWENDFDIIDEVYEKFLNVYEKYDMANNHKIDRFYDIPKFKNCFVSDSVTGNKVAKKRLGSNHLKSVLGFEKGYIPNWVLEGDKETQWEYIRGLFIADGTVNISNGKGDPIYLSLTSTNKGLLEQLQIMLLNLGCRFGLYDGDQGGYRKLPDGKGDYAEYLCKPTYRLVCGNRVDALSFEKSTGFLTRKSVFVEDREYRDNTRKSSKVVSVEYVGKEDVYCVEVDTEDHLWVCNGVITSNCSEILLFCDEDHTFTCVLSSMNLKYWDDWKDTDAVYIATVFLDCVAEEFIQQAKDIEGLERAVRYTEKGRSLGLGVLGLHTLYQEKMLPFESFDAMMLNAQIFKHIHDQSLEASKWMAGSLGEPEWCKGYGVRNTHRMAIAPTMSTSLLMGGVSQGIEPIVMNVFSQITSAGSVRRINPTLLSLMHKRGVYNKETLRDIEEHQGSVQHVNWLSDEEKAVFLTAFEINQKSIIRQASQRQKFIDQAQSLNTFFDANESEEWISEVMQEFVEDPYLSTVYYQRSMQGVKASKGECVACEA